MAQSLLDIRTLLKNGEAHLIAAGVPNARRNVEWIMRDTLGCSTLELYVNATRPAAEQETHAYWQRVERRARREPLQYILGVTEFMSLEFSVGPGVFVPRPDTEVLVEHAEARLRGLPLHEPMTVLDLCSGSGAIGVSIAARLSNAEVVAVDVSKNAVAATIANARRNDVAARVRVWRDDAATFLDHPPAGDPERFGAILCNPPYIESGLIDRLPPEVREHEPVEALDGGHDGLDACRDIVPRLHRRTRDGGFAMIEVGDTQAGAVSELFVDAGWTGVEVFSDYAGRDRVVAATWPGGEETHG